MTAMSRDVPLKSKGGIVRAGKPGETIGHSILGVDTQRFLRVETICDQGVLRFRSEKRGEF